MENANKNANAFQKADTVEGKERSTVDRQWVALTAYQPVDIVTKTVEVPVIKTVEKIVPKTILQEKIVHVPKNVTHIVEKIVEVPEVKYIEKVVEVPHIHYKNKYVPKIEIVEKVIERQKVIEKWHDKIVEVPQIKEVVRFKQIEDAEEVIKYIPKNSGNIDWESEYRKYLQRKQLTGFNADNATAYQQINSFNEYNENTYTQNAFDRTYEFVNHTSLNEPTDFNQETFAQTNYGNQFSRGAIFEQDKNIPNSSFDVHRGVQIKRLASEDAKPVGCCANACS